MVLRLPDSWSNWNLECWFLRRGENCSTRRTTSRSKGENQQQTTNSTHIWRRRRDLNPGNIGGRAWASERSHHCTIPCSPQKIKHIWVNKIRHIRVNSKQISNAGNLLGMLSYFGTKSIYNFLSSLKKKHLCSFWNLCILQTAWSSHQ